MKNNETPPLKFTAVTYARVSSKEQEREGFSIPAQTKLLQEYAQKNGLKIVREFVDVETAKKAGRTEFTEMVNFLRTESRNKSQLACKILLVEKTDRLYRNFKDYVIIEELMEGVGLKVHFVKENEILSSDVNSPKKFMHGIQVLMAKNYIDNLKEEVRKGMLEKAKQGFYPSCTPIGYINTVFDGKKIIAPDPTTAPLVKRIFQLYATGNFSLKELRKKIVGDGLDSRQNGRGISRAALAKILNNPIYYGDFEWNKKIFVGSHEALISKEQFQQVQRVLNYKGQTRLGTSKHEWLFHGLVSCGHCGCAMVAEIKKGKYIYYRCTGYKGKCPEKYVREETLNQHFEMALKSIHLDSDVLELVVKALKESHQDESQYHHEAITNLERERKKLLNRLDGLYLDKLDGNISAQSYQEMNKSWQDQLQSLNNKLEKHGAAHSSYIAEGVRLLEVSHQALDLYRRFDLFEKRRILQLVLSNSIWLNAQLVPKYRQPFDLFALTKTTMDGKESVFSLEQSKTEEWCTR